MKILVKWPTRSRPEKFAKVLRIYQELRTTDAVDFLITIDADDKSMNNPRTLGALKNWGNLTYEIIEPCGKIGAINSGVTNISHKYDIIVLASDDMIPVVHGWDKRIMNDMAKYFPDTDGVLWYNDGHTEDRLNTLTIMGTKYYRRFDYLYHPDYIAFWCDNELTDVANHLGKQKYSPDVIIRHEHPMNGYGRTDNLNVRDSRFYNADKKTYEERKSRGFDLDIPVIEYFGTDHSKPEGNVSEPNIGAGQPNKRKRGRPAGAGSKLVGQSSAKYRREA
jgi:hypothetical protein